jgi:hypothetical protein
MYPESQVLQHRRAGVLLPKSTATSAYPTPSAPGASGLPPAQRSLGRRRTLVVAIGHQVQQTVIQSCITMTPVLSCGTWRVSLILCSSPAWGIREQ